MRKRYSRSYTVLSFLTMFSYRELPFGACFLLCLLIAAQIGGLIALDAGTELVVVAG